MEARKGISSGIILLGPEDPSSYCMIRMTESPNHTYVPEAAVAAVTVGGSDGSSAVGASDGAAGEGISSRVTLLGPEVPSSYRTIPMTESSPHNHVPEAAVAATAVGGGDGAAAAAPAPVGVGASPVNGGMDGAAMKKKRGRPRKYGPDGSIAFPLSPVPISSCPPPSNKFSSGKRAAPVPIFSCAPPSNNFSSKKRGRDFKPCKKPSKELFGDGFEWCTGSKYRSHIMMINSGEDITSSLISFAQKGPGNRTVCVLSATGLISEVALRHHNCSSGIVHYEGLFDIISLVGSFIPCEIDGRRSLQGGMSVTLVNSHDFIVGGGVSGPLLAASPVQVVLGSFELLKPKEGGPKRKRAKSDKAVANDAPGMVVSPKSTNAVANDAPSMAVRAAALAPNAEKEDDMSGQAVQNPGAMNSNRTSPSSFVQENWAGMHSVLDSGASASDVNMSLYDD